MFEKTNPSALRLEYQAIWVFFCAVIYFYAFKVNSFLFDWLEFSSGVSWIFIPSGLRLVFVLVLHHAGAIGIVLASCLINYTQGQPDAHLFNIVTGLVSGLSPFLARFIAIDFFKFNTNLDGLTLQNLFKTSVLFAVISGILHQLWFFWFGLTDTFVSHTFVMVVGDCVGTILVMVSASFLFKTCKKLFIH
jgi:hypothetical protein